MREKGWREEDVERVVGAAMPSGPDDLGNPTYIGFIRDLRVRVVIALDEPDLVVTIHERRK
jgi:hypothetical protein